MALPDSALSGLMEVFRTGEGTDFIRECPCRDAGTHRRRSHERDRRRPL